MSAEYRSAHEDDIFEGNIVLAMFFVSDVYKSPLNILLPAEILEIHKAGNRKIVKVKILATDIIFDAGDDWLYVKDVPRTPQRTVGPEPKQRLQKRYPAPGEK